MSTAIVPKSISAVRPERAVKQPKSGIFQKVPRSRLIIWLVRDEIRLIMKNEHHHQLGGKIPNWFILYLPMNAVTFGLIIPLGKRWKSYSTASTTTVWPALFPP